LAVSRHCRRWILPTSATRLRRERTRNRSSKTSTTYTAAGSSSICMVQINLQHCRAAASVLCKQLSEYETVIALVQEPWIRKGKILGLNTKGINLFRGCLTGHPRTCVLINGLHALDSPQFGTKDVTAVRIDYKKADRMQALVVASVYLPIDTAPPTKELEQLVMHCESKNLPIVIACNSNSHHTAWGSSECIAPGIRLLEYLTTTGLEIANIGHRS